MRACSKIKSSWLHQWWLKSTSRMQNWHLIWLSNAVAHITSLTNNLHKISTLTVGSFFLFLFSFLVCLCRTALKITSHILGFTFVCLIKIKWEIVRWILTSASLRVRHLSPKMAPALSLLCVNKNSTWYYINN